VNLTTFLHVVAKLRMSVAINSPPISSHGKQKDNFVGLNKCLLPDAEGIRGGAHHSTGLQCKIFSYKARSEGRRLMFIATSEILKYLSLLIVNFTSATTCHV
jgi:hypothetical protein